MRALSLETLSAGKSYGHFRALDGVSLKVRAGTVHALLGENGAGKSTLVKGLVGYDPLDSGSSLVSDRERQIRAPREAHALGSGLVYRQFTVAPSPSGAGDPAMCGGEPAEGTRWKAERGRVRRFTDDRT